MYYWSRWTNMTTTDFAAETAQETRSSWRETRPVVVVARSRTQALSQSVGQPRGRVQVRDTSPHISLEVRRSRTYTTGSQEQARWKPEATTASVLTK